MGIKHDYKPLYSAEHAKPKMWGDIVIVIAASVILTIELWVQL